MTWGEAGYPYQNYSEHQLYEAVKDKNVRPPVDNLKNYPVSLLKLVQEMWQKDPKEVEKKKFFLAFYLNLTLTNFLLTFSDQV